MIAIDNVQVIGLVGAPVLILLLAEVIARSRWNGAPRFLVLAASNSPDAAALRRRSRGPAPSWPSERWTVRSFPRWSLWHCPAAEYEYGLHGRWRHAASSRPGLGNQ